MLRASRLVSKEPLFFDSNRRQTRFVMAKNRCLAPKSAQSKRRRLQPERHTTFRNATSYKKYTDFTSSSGENEKILFFLRTSFFQRIQILSAILSCGALRRQNRTSLSRRARRCSDSPACSNLRDTLGNRARPGICV